MSCGFRVSRDSYAATLRSQCALISVEIAFRDFVVSLIDNGTCINEEVPASAVVDDNAVDAEGKKRPLLESPPAAMTSLHLRLLPAGVAPRTSGEHSST